MIKTVFLVLLAALLTGCAGSIQHDVSVSQGCSDAMAALELVPLGDDEAEASAVTLTTKECATANEYIAAVKANPAAWAYTSADKIQEDLLLTSACLRNSSEAPCVDAKERGLID